VTDFAATSPFGISGNTDSSFPVELFVGKAHPGSLNRKEVMIPTRTERILRAVIGPRVNHERRPGGDTARKHDLTLPTSMNAWCQEELSKLQPLSGSEFDREFARGRNSRPCHGHRQAPERTCPKSRTPTLRTTRETCSQSSNGIRTKRERSPKAVGLDQATIAALETQPPEGVGTPGASQTEHGTSSREQDHKETKDRDLQHEP